MIVYQITLGSNSLSSTQPHNTVAAEKYNTVPTQDRGRPREEATAHLPDGEKTRRDVGDGQVDELHTGGQLPRVVSSL
jgi:hypothetical protein